jgi:hypothetical protein
MFDFLKNLDKRWIFLLMFLSVVIPIYIIGKTGKTFPEEPTVLSIAVFQAIEELEEGDPVLLSFDFDPASEGELGPMATSFVRHCCEKKLKIYFMALWPVGPQMVDDTIARVIWADFPWMEYGKDYCNIGFKPGMEGVIKVVVTDLRELYTTDAMGTNIDDIPMMEGIHSVQDFDLLINVSAGYAGTKEWVQYAVTPYPDKIKLIAGCTGVQAPLLYLGAIKGAAEYEKLVIDKYGGDDPDPKYLEAKRRMGPQLVAHILIILLIVVANIIYFVEKRGEVRS